MNAGGCFLFIKNFNGFRPFYLLLIAREDCPMLNGQLKQSLYPSIQYNPRLNYRFSFAELSNLFSELLQCTTNLFIPSLAYTIARKTKINIY